MGVEIRIEKNPHPEWDLEDVCWVCNGMFTYTGAEYIPYIYVNEERINICGNCLKEGPEAIKEMVIGRIRELQADIQPKLKEAALLEKIASGDITGPWDDHEKISKCVECKEYNDDDEEDE